MATRVRTSKRDGTAASGLALYNITRVERLEHARTRTRHARHALSSLLDDRRGGGGGRYDDRRGGDRYDDRRRDDRYDDRRRGDGYDDRRRDDRDRYDDRRRDDRDRDSRSGGGGGSSSRSGVPPAVFANWKPSERVQALSVNQVRVPPHSTPRRA